MNNLFVCEQDNYVLWNMKDVVGCDDVCVGFHSVGEESLYFVVFVGFGFIMNINTLEIVSKVMTK